MHINDPDYYDEVNAGGGRRRDKDPRFVRLYGADQGTLVTLDHHLHRIRRSALNPFFSKTNIRRLEPIIQRRAQKVLSRMEKLESTGQPLVLFNLFSAFTSDVIIEYAFGESHDYLGRDDLNEDFYHMMDSMHHMGAAAKQFSWLMPLLLSIPQPITTRLDKGMAAFAALQNVSLPSNSVEDLTRLSSAAKRKSAILWLICMITKTENSQLFFTTCS